MKKIIPKLLALAVAVIAALLISFTSKPANVGSEAYTVLNDNVPSFTQDEITDIAFELYSELDALGRCGTALACIGPELMPTEERGSIGQVKPSGWKTAKYDFVDGKYLYNRCHLIGYQLTGENANERNLITGTRYMNVDGMLPFENLVADYIDDTGNHVMYRVTPHFEGVNLVASGVEMEALSVEDDGEGVQFHVMVHNIQPGVEVSYLDGESRVVSEPIEEPTETDSDAETTYILNTNTMKFHEPDCASVRDTKPQNKKEYTGTRQWLIDNRYAPCGACKP